MLRSSFGSAHATAILRPVGLQFSNLDDSTKRFVTGDGTPKAALEKTSPSRSRWPRKRMR